MKRTLASAALVASLLLNATPAYAYSFVRVEAQRTSVVPTANAYFHYEYLHPSAPALDYLDYSEEYSDWIGNFDTILPSGEELMEAMGTEPVHESAPVEQEEWPNWIGEQPIYHYAPTELLHAQADLSEPSSVVWPSWIAEPWYY